MNGKIIQKEEIEKIVFHKESNPFSYSEDFLKNKNFKMAVCTIENKRFSKAEMHQKDDDIYIVLDGSATIKLNGALTEQEEISPGEFKGSDIENGLEKEIKKGDLISIPKGTPHMVDARNNKRISYIVIKVWGKNE